VIKENEIRDTTILEQVFCLILIFACLS